MSYSAKQIREKLLGVRDRLVDHLVEAVDGASWKDATPAQRLLTGVLENLDTVKDDSREVDHIPTIGWADISRGWKNGDQS